MIANLLTTRPSQRVFNLFYITSPEGHVQKREVQTWLFFFKFPVSFKRICPIFLMLRMERGGQILSWN